MLLNLCIHKQSCNFDHLVAQVYQQRVGSCLGTLGEQLQLLFERFFDFFIRHGVISFPPRPGLLCCPVYRAVRVLFCGCGDVQDAADAGHDTRSCRLARLDFVEIAPIEVFARILCHLVDEPGVRAVDFHKANLDLLAKLTKRLLFAHIITPFY